MKAFFREFVKRGLLFAWGGPAVVAIVWLCIHQAGELENLEVGQAALGVLSSTVLAFVAAGITAVYQIERLPKPMAGLIQLGVLYVDYLAVYLLNGWIKRELVALFTGIFLAAFALIWGAVYLTTRRSVRRMNQLVEKEK